MSNRETLERARQMIWQIQLPVQGVSPSPATYTTTTFPSWSSSTSVSTINGNNYQTFSLPVYVDPRMDQLISAMATLKWAVENMLVYLEEHPVLHVADTLDEANGVDR